MNGYLNAIILSIHHLIVGDEVINLEHLKQDAESAIKRDKEKDAELEKLRAQVAQAPVVADILFDGYAVWEALPNRDAVHRKYVSDILDTVVRLLKESKS